MSGKLRSKKWERKTGRLLISTSLAVGVFLPLVVLAQYRSYRSYREPSLKYDDKWAFTRIRYSPNSSWNHDYPRADRHLAYIISDLSTARTHTDGSNVLDLDDPEMFHHPLIYMSEPEASGTCETTRLRIFDDTF